MPVDVMRETLRRFDRHRRQLLICELVDGSGRTFQLAFQIGLTECSAIFETIVNRAGPPRRHPAPALPGLRWRIIFAAAVMMPYQAFHSAAETLSYDVHVLAQRFNAGFEQVCHRLTTLQRPNARGIPFFLLRVDNAGNVSKRFSSGTFPFSKFAGTCPAVERALDFRHPGPAAQAGDRTSRRHAYFSIAQMVRRPVAPHPQPHRALRSGSAAKSATPPNWSTPAAWIWKRPRARRSAQLPALRTRKLQPARRAAITRTLILDENTRRVSSFAFSNAREL